MIYFIKEEDTDRVKIGFVKKDLDRRLKQLQTANPNKLSLMNTIEGSRADEKLIHKVFGADRIRGEWFHIHEDMMSKDLESLMRKTDITAMKPRDRKYVKFYLALKDQPDFVVYQPTNWFLTTDALMDKMVIEHNIKKFKTRSKKTHDAIMSGGMTSWRFE